MGNQNCKLESLDLYKNIINDDNVVELVASLVNGCTLKKLDLGQNTSISTTGWMAIMRLIQHTKCNLEVLATGGNTIDDEVTTTLAASLTQNCSLKSLDLGHCSLITLSGWTEISTAFSNPGCTLESLSLRHSHIGEDVATILANSLGNNATLNILNIEGNLLIIDAAWNKIAVLLCNGSSIESTYGSNHKLTSLLAINHHHILPQYLTQYLKLNENNKHGNGSQKFIRCHLSGRFSMGPFVEMNVELLVHLLASLGKVDPGNDRFSGENNLISQSALFHFLRKFKFFLVHYYYEH